MIRVLISQTRGVAVFDDGRRLGLLDVRSPDTPEYLADHVAARALSEASDLESLQVVDLPALRAHLELRRRRQELLHAALILLDGERTDELRAEAAKALNRDFSVETWEWVEGVLMSAPLPKSADTRRASTWKTPCATFLAELERNQGKIRVLQTAWHSLPGDLFVRETRDQVRAKVVRQGVFQILLQGKAPSPYSPFASALASYASALEQGTGSRIRSDLPRNLNWHIGDTADVTDVHCLWDVSPWASAWLAADWPRLESTLACNAASKWSDHFISAKSFQFSRLERGALDSLFKCWESVRHHSSLSSSVDLIWDLAFVDRDISQTTLRIFEAKASSGRSSHHQRRVRDLVDFGVLTKHCGDVPERRLHLSLLALFDARDKSGREISTLLSDRSEATRLKTFALCAHRALAASTPLDADCLLHEMTDARVREIVPLVDADMASWIDPLRDVISIYALDRLFQREGGVLHFTPHAIRSATGASQHSVVLANFSNRRTHVFDGYLAWILTRLGERLSADLGSGLPQERCGWTTLNELGKGFGRGPDTVRQGIDALRRRATGAGFAQATVQGEGDEVRLNPEYAAPSMQASRGY